MNYEVAEFIVNNRDYLNAYMDGALAPCIKAARIFDNNPDLQLTFVRHKKLLTLRDYIAEHFPSLTPEELSSIDLDYLKLLNKEE